MRASKYLVPILLAVAGGAAAQPNSDHIQHTACNSTYADGRSVSVTPDGTVTVTFADKHTVTTAADGRTITSFPDGTKTMVAADGSASRIGKDGKPIVDPQKMKEMGKKMEQMGQNMKQMGGDMMKQHAGGGMKMDASEMSSMGGKMMEMGKSMETMGGAMPDAAHNHSTPAPEPPQQPMSEGHM